MLENIVSLAVRIAEPGQGLGHGVVDNLDDTAAHQPLVFYQCNVRFYPGCVAVHHEGDCTCRGYDRDLSVLVAETFTERQCIIPGLDSCLPKVRRNGLFADLVRMCSVHVDNTQEGFLVRAVA